MNKATMPQPDAKSQRIHSQAVVHPVTRESQWVLQAATNGTAQLDSRNQTRTEETAKHQMNRKDPKDRKVWKIGNTDDTSSWSLRRGGLRPASWGETHGKAYPNPKRKCFLHQRFPVRFTP
jgi:hypothetical protein